MSLYSFINCSVISTTATLQFYGQTCSFSDAFLEPKSDLEKHHQHQDRLLWGEGAAGESKRGFWPFLKFKDIEVDDPFAYHVPRWCEELSQGRNSQQQTLLLAWSSWCFDGWCLQGHPVWEQPLPSPSCPLWGCGQCKSVYILLESKKLEIKHGKNAIPAQSLKCSDKNKQRYQINAFLSHQGGVKCSENHIG